MVSPAQKPYRSKQDYATPAAFLEAITQRLGIVRFVFDFAADTENATAPAWWAVTDDALTHSAEEWATKTSGGWGWLNPPYTRIGPWARQCAAVRRCGGRVALLVPAAVGSNWFRDAVDGQALVLLLNGRLAFMPEEPTWKYPKDCVLALYAFDVMPGYEVWTWPH